MRISEDELANALITSHISSSKEFWDVGEDEIGVYPEAHYNHYGSRGVADLYLTVGDMEGHLYELKSESALEQVTGANAVIRQFNQMKKYFFEGSDHQLPTWDLTFELCFTPSEKTIRHIAENSEMYASLVDEVGPQLDDGEGSTSVTVRKPGDLRPIIFFSPNLDFREGFDDSTFLEYVEYNQPELFSRFRDTFEDIC